MEQIFYKPLQDGWIEVVDSVKTLEDGTEIKHTHREDNPAPNTYPKYAEAVKHWTAQGLTVYDRGDYYEFAEPEPLPEPTAEEKASAIRSQRDALINETNWLVERHREETERVKARVEPKTTLTAEQYAELLAYRQALRDVPEQTSFPDTVVFPTKPSFVK